MATWTARASAALIFAAFVVGFLLLVRGTPNTPGKPGASHLEPVELAVLEPTAAADVVPSATVEPKAEDGVEPASDAARVIEGWVADSNGDKIAGAQIGASSDEGASFTSTDDEGHFRLVDLPSNRVNVFVTAPGRAPDHAHNVPAGTKELVLIADDPAQVRGTVDAGAYAHLFVRLCHHSEEFDKEICIKSKYSSPPAPDFQMKGLPSGEYDVVFSSEDVELSRVPVELKPGATTTVPRTKL